MESCLFCDIVAGKLPAARVYETATVLAFLDVNPVVQGHTLVIPKHHTRNLFDLKDEVAPDLLQAATRVARALRQALKADGLNLVQSNEAAGGQSIYHLHLHLLPRYWNDGVLEMEGPHRFLRWHVLGHFRATELEPVALQIRAALDVPPTAPLVSSPAGP